MPYYKKTVRFQSQRARSGSRFKKVHKTIGKTLLIACAGIAVLGIFLFAVLATWISRSLPNPNTLLERNIPQSTKIYDRTGTYLLFEIHGDEKRTLVKIQDIPDMVKYATIAVEDKKFFEHRGVYWKGVLRAIFVNIFQGGYRQGASTLTQQLVKNALLSRERTASRKMKELLLALQIERVYRKDQILQLYFNEIPYGSTIYGIESAAQTYFATSSRNLLLDEAALLAAIPQAPDTYSPYGTGSRGDNRPRLVARQHKILDLMVEQGYVTKERADEAKKIDTLKKIKPKNFGDIRAPHFVMHVRSLLTEKYGQHAVEEGGLKVTTTLDWDKQQAAETAVTKGVEARGKQYHFTNAALISLDPKNGHIVAMVGSKDFLDAEHDGQVNVTLRPRQPGSSFKPIVYAAGFMRGYLPETQLWDVQTVFRTDVKDFEPHDYDGKERGPVSIRQALQGSLNIPAVKMLYLVGVGRVLDFAESLGYTTLNERSRFGLALVLGGGEVKPIEHAAAFATFANDGLLYPTAAILKVEDSTGKILEEWKLPTPTRVMEPQIARIVSSVLSDNEARAPIFGAKNSLTLPDRPVAAKTGTTNDYHDAWTAGYTPNLAAVVWVGNNNNQEMKRGADGSIVAAPIWQAYMREATKKLAKKNFIPPDPLTETKPVLLGQIFAQTILVNRSNGKRATSSTPPELIEARTFYQPHSILQFIDKDDPAGPAPTNPAQDPQYENWEHAIQTWVEKNSWHTTDTAPIPTESDQSEPLQSTSTQGVSSTTMN
ncbi:MAG: transglycosylase domain-containing protein [Candidatus Uhrbacteria bacterium]|nr:transglycosylase domain-containing protein [Candidatus Uhrbacteria bacterium]